MRNFKKKRIHPKMVPMYYLVKGKKTSPTRHKNFASSMVAKHQQREKIKKRQIHRRDFSSFHNKKKPLVETLNFGFEKFSLGVFSLSPEKLAHTFDTAHVSILPPPHNPPWKLPAGLPRACAAGTGGRRGGRWRRPGTAPPRPPSARGPPRWRTGGRRGAGGAPAAGAAAGAVPAAPGWGGGGPN